AIHLSLEGLEDLEPFIKIRIFGTFIVYKTFIAVVKRWCTSFEEFLPDDSGIHRVVYSVILYDTSDSENDICMNDIVKKTIFSSLECKLPKSIKGTFSYCKKRLIQYGRNLHPAYKVHHVGANLLVGIGISATGFLTHVTQNGEIYLRFLHPESSWLEIELEKHSINFEKSCMDQTILVPEKIYAAKYVDGKWYRAVVSNNAIASDPQTIEVIFIDYGHPSLVRRSEICETEPHSEILTSVGNQAIKCELFEALPSPSCKWTDAATLKLQKLAPFNEELIVRVIEETTINSVAKVNLHKRIYTKEDSFIISVNENLANRSDLFLNVTASEITASSKHPTHLNLQFNKLAHASKSSITNFVPKIPTLVEDSVTNPFRKISVSNSANDDFEWLPTPDAVKSPDAYEDASPIPISPPGVPTEGEMFDVFVTMAATPHNFVVQPLKSASEMNKLMNQMQQFYSVEDNLIEMHPSLLKANHFYAALHSDESWYRVRLVSFNTSEPVMAAVYYVDFGDFNSVTLQNLQKLYNQFRNLPCQAIKASLSGVVPLQIDWDPEHCVQFKSMINEKKFVSIIQNKKLVKEADFSFLELELTLIDTSIPDKDVYIHEILTEKGMARPIV
ncbi:tudor domain-containing protein 7, partial [Caerostris extrusa]